MTPRSFTPALVAGLLATLAAAQAQAPATLRIDEAFGLRSNWDMASDDAYLATRAGAMEGLTRIDFDGKLAPSLATEWHQTDPLTWQFKLRQGVTFHDGTKLDAKTASNALNELLRAQVPARAFSSKLIKSVEPAGDDLVQVTTLSPMVLLPSIMAAPATSILAPSAYRDGRVSPLGTGTGPFVMKEADPAHGLVVVRNDAYWGGKPALERVDIRFIVDATVRATQARTKEVDIARSVPAATIRQLSGTAGVRVESMAAPRDNELLLNNQRAPLNNVKVRQAILAAIDTAGLNAAVYEGAMQPATGVFLAGDPWASTTAKPAFDVQKARALLKEAGIQPGTLKLGLLAYTSKSEFKNVAEVIQSLLGEVGIQVDVRVAEYNAIEPAMLAGNFDMALMSRGYLTDGGEPGGFLNADYGCAGSFNMSHFCDPAVDAKLKEAAQTADAAKRHAIYSDVAAQIQRDAVTVFLVNETIFDGVSNRVQNYRPHPLNYYLLVPGLAVK